MGRLGGLTKTSCWGACWGGRPPLLPEDNSLGHPHRGVSCAHLSGPLIDQIQMLHTEGMLSNDKPKIYDIEPLVIRPKGSEIICPRDGRLGAAYVDCISEAGFSSFMLSYTWGYEVAEICNTLTQYCTRGALDMKSTIFWICCFCVNQHRVQEEQKKGNAVPFNHFCHDFADKVKNLSVICMMSPWQDPVYLKRVWCVFEMYMSGKSGRDVSIVMPSDAEKLFQKELLAGGSDKLWDALKNIDIQHAEASVSGDRDQIFSLIESDYGPGFPKLNQTVAKRLKSWAAGLSKSFVLERISARDLPDIDLGNLCLRVHNLLKQCGLNRETAEIRETGVEAFQRAGALATPGGLSMMAADILTRMHLHDTEGAVAARKKMHALVDFPALEPRQAVQYHTGSGMAFVSEGDFASAANHFSDAVRILEKADMLKGVGAGISLGLVALVGMVAFRDAEASLANMKRAIEMFDNLGDGNIRWSPDNAVCLLWSARIKNMCGQLEGALADVEEARTIYEKLGGVEFSMHGSGVMLMLGVLLSKAGQNEAAQIAFDEGVRIADEQGILEFYLSFMNNDGAAEKMILTKLYEQSTGNLR